MADGTQDDNRWWTLGVVCIATFMLLLDITIVNVAIPDIAKDLHSSFSSLQWVVDAYSLGLAALLLTWGSLSDIVGRRAVFLIGLVVFSLASLACGLSDSPITLDIARGIQGLGGAAMLATGLALIAAAFSGQERARAIGIWGATIGAGVAIGPLVGGVLTEKVGWQSIFFVNVPIGGFGILMTLLKVRESRGRSRRIDYGGLVTFSSGLFFLIFALVRGNAEGWGSTLIVTFLIAAVVLLVGFVVVEQRSKEPMLDLSLFRNHTFAGASIVAFCLSAGMFALFLYLTLYIQNSLVLTPLAAGLRFIPMTLLSFFVAPIAGNLSLRIPTSLLMGAGLTLVAIGLLLMTGIDADSKWTVLLPGFIISGIGIGMVNAPLASTAVGVVEPQRSGMASGINNTFRQVGIATGIAALGAIFQSLLTNKFPGGPPGEVLAVGARNTLGPARAHEFLAGYTDALSTLLIIGAGLSVVGAVASLVLVRRADFVAMPGAEAAGAHAEGAHAAAV